MRRDCRLFEVPVSEMVERCAQEQALPITEGNASIFERIEGFLQFAAGLPTPKIAIKIHMQMRRLFVHRSRMGASWARDSIFLGVVGNLGSNKMDHARMEGCNHWVGGGQPRWITPSVGGPYLWKAPRKARADQAARRRDTCSGAQRSRPAGGRTRCTSDSSGNYVGCQV